MNDYEYIEFYVTKEQLEELKQIKQKVSSLFKNINDEYKLKIDEHHLLIKSLESYICCPYIDVDGYYIR